MRQQRELSVGILSGAKIDFSLADGRLRSAFLCEGRISLDGELHDEITFDSPFELYGVVIGVDFHWQRRETQKFEGKLKLIVEHPSADLSVITAVNIIGIEDYLHSVISSEMKATSSLELLKAHAVISRSWLLAQIERKCGGCEKGRPDFVENAELTIRWADREDHANFDVCADDHCQRYQGVTRIWAAAEKVREAIEATWGEVLVSDGAICDARFSKCCGGTTELFSTCWEERDYPYLQPVPDRPSAEAEDFCNTSDREILSQVLNDYDLETGDFYHWQVSYTASELAALIRKRSGIDFGEKILSLEPVERGASGRIKLLRLVGSDRTMTIGKELTIRRWLSESHLKSSAFEVRREGDLFVLDGHGWGHGVGLCQIGAAVMGAQGYTYQQILMHYYPGSELRKL